MSEYNEDKQDQFIVVVRERSGDLRAWGRTKTISVETLHTNINFFLDNIGKILDETPEHLGSFRFVELEIHAEVTTKGDLAILGTGGEAGAQGGLKFIFRRSSAW